MTDPAPFRLPSRSQESIDRSQTFTITFDGRRYAAHPGDTIASALAAAGVRVFSRSFKYHRPRGLLCCSGQCPNCLVQVGDEPNVRACRRPAEPGLAVTSQNAWPSLRLDLMSLTGLADPLLPVGFYYKAFIRPKALWPTFEHVLRTAAGLGRVSPDTHLEGFDKQYLHADLVVVGAGPAGLRAALEAAALGAEVALFDDQPAPGGRLRYGPGRESEALPGLLSELAAQPRITLYPEATVLGWYEDNWLSAVARSRLYKVRARAVVFATGAVEQPLVFPGNDLPGVMLGSAVLRLLNLHAVAPGRRALVATANEDGWAVAAALQAAGVEVVGVVDPWPDAPPNSAAHERAGVARYPGYYLAAAWGGGRVQGATLVSPGGDRRGIACDLVVTSVGWAPASGLLHQAGGQLAFDEERGEFLPVSLPEGIFAAGRVAGAHGLESELSEGRLAGRTAAAFLSLAREPEAESPARGPARTHTRVGAPGPGKKFVCYCEDVTVKDLQMAVEEGYDSMELLKRYSTISMGPCQGAMCSLNTIHLCARATDRTVAETGTTTARPPMRPVRLAALAGQHMEPVQVTPVHDWHCANGARMMVAGLWLRPDHYGDPTAEVRAVRERVGLIDVSTLGKLALTGPGVPALLERLYVNRWRELGVGQVRYGLMCNDEGVVLDDGVTARLSEGEWYTTTTSSGAGAIYEWIQWWAQSGWGDGVHIANRTEDFAAFNLAGPRSREVLAGLTPADVSSQGFRYMRVLQAEVAGVPCRILRIGFTGELSYEIHCPAGFALHLWEALMAAGEAHGIRPFGMEAQRVLRLEKAHLIVGQDTDATSDPLSAGQAWAVKLDKVDFLGRRALVGISSAGVRQRLVGFTMVDSHLVPAEGLQIVATESNGRHPIIGWVTSSRFSPTLGQAIGLCWLPVDVAARPGASFHILIDGRRAEARVHHGPFYDPAGDRLRA